MPQKEYFNLNELEDILEQENFQNIFLVTGKNSYETCGAKNYIDKLKEYSKLNSQLYQIQEDYKDETWGGRVWPEEGVSKRSLLPTLNIEFIQRITRVFPFNINIII